MDLVLNYCDDKFFTPFIYPRDLPESSKYRQFASLFIILTISGYLLYFLAAGLNFILVFDRRLMKHPLFLKNQISKEITVACKSLPIMAILSALSFMVEINYCTNFYENFENTFIGWFRIISSIIFFILFTDCLIYFIHRVLHYKHFYKVLHKDHHRWKVPTPFASHAFHPVDGFLQSSPYHIYPFFFPMNKYVYLIMFTVVNFWTVSIHDGDFRVPKYLRNIVNGSAHHTDHHLFYNYNYGQFFTLWDRLLGSYKFPSAFEGNSPLSQIISKTDDNCNKLK